MKTIYTVRIEAHGYNEGHRLYFENRNDALKAVEGNEGDLAEIPVLTSFAEWEIDYKWICRRRIWDKLTPPERESLNLADPYQDRPSISGA